MEKDKVINTIITNYAILFSEALTLWEKQPKKSFLTCWTQAVQNCDFLEFYALGGTKKLKKSKIYASNLLRESGSQLADFVSAQAFVYASEYIKNNIDKFPEDQQKLFDDIKKVIFNSDKEETPSIDEERLLRGIRNSFAHNNDEELPNVQYDNFNKKFTIHFGKIEDYCVTLGKVEMYKLLEIYAKHVHELKSSKYYLVPNMQVYVPTDKPSKNLFKLVDRETEQQVEPDEHQTEALDGIVDRVRQGAFVPNWSDWLLTLFYPYKNNSANNSVKMSVLAIYIKDLIDFKDYDLKGFGMRCRVNNYIAFNENTSALDDVSLFMANILFVLCSNSPNELMQECIEGISDINMTKVRNSIVHGTYFHDKKMGFHFYDSAKKAEHLMKYVGYLSYKDIVALKDKVSEKKFEQYSKDSKITMGTKGVHEPFVKE